MGFTIYYRSTNPVTEHTRRQVDEATDRLCAGHSWMSCEPVWFFHSADGDQYLEGGSKPNFSLDTDDIDDAEAAGFRDGTIEDVVQVLCELSRTFGIDWVFSHDHDPGPIGFVRDGRPDAELYHQIEMIAALAEAMVGRLDWGQPSTPRADTQLAIEFGDTDHDDDEPTILKFPGVVD